MFIVDVFPPKMEPDGDACVFPPKMELVLLPLKIEVFAEVVGMPPNIDVFVVLPKGMDAGLIIGLPKVFAAEETAGVLGN